MKKLVAFNEQGYLINSEEIRIPDESPYFSTELILGKNSTDTTMTTNLFIMEEVEGAHIENTKFDIEKFIIENNGDISFIEGSPSETAKLNGISIRPGNHLNKTKAKILHAQDADLLFKLGSKIKISGLIENGESYYNDKIFTIIELLPDALVIETEELNEDTLANKWGNDSEPNYYTYQSYKAPNRRIPQTLEELRRDEECKFPDPNLIQIMNSDPARPRVWYDFTNAKISSFHVIKVENINNNPKRNQIVSIFGEPNIGDKLVFNIKGKDYTFIVRKEYPVDEIEDNTEETLEALEEESNLKPYISDTRLLRGVEEDFTSREDGYYLEVSWYIPREEIGDFNVKLVPNKDFCLDVKIERCCDDKNFYVSRDNCCVFKANNRYGIPRVKLIKEYRSLTLEKLPCSFTYQQRKKKKIKGNRNFVLNPGCGFTISKQAKKKRINRHYSLGRIPCAFEARNRTIKKDISRNFDLRKCHIDTINRSLRKPDLNRNYELKRIDLNCITTKTFKPISGKFDYNVKTIHAPFAKQLQLTKSAIDRAFYLSLKKLDAFERKRGTTSSINRDFLLKQYSLFYKQLEITKEPAQDRQYQVRRIDLVNYKINNVIRSEVFDRDYQVRKELSCVIKDLQSKGANNPIRDYRASLMRLNNKVNSSKERKKIERRFLLEKLALCGNSITNKTPIEILRNYVTDIVKLCNFNERPKASRVFINRNYELKYLNIKLNQYQNGHSVSLSRDYKLNKINLEIGESSMRGAPQRPRRNYNISVKTIPLNRINPVSEIRNEIRNYNLSIKRIDLNRVTPRQSVIERRNYLLELLKLNNVVIQPKSVMNNDIRNYRLKKLDFIYRKRALFSNTNTPSRRYSLQYKYLNNRFRGIRVVENQTPSRNFNYVFNTLKCIEERKIQIKKENIVRNRYYSLHKVELNRPSERKSSVSNRSNTIRRYNLYKLEKFNYKQRQLIENYLNANRNYRLHYNKFPDFNIENKISKLLVSNKTFALKKVKFNLSPNVDIRRNKLLKKDIPYELDVKRLELKPYWRIASKDGKIIRDFNFREIKLSKKRTPAMNKLKHIPINIELRKEYLINKRTNF